jgi:nicotinate phosphoribosyltransferase
MPQLPISDEYFNRSAAIVANTPLYNKRVRYCVFAREGGVVCGVNHAVAWIEQQCLGPLAIRARWDGDRFAPNEAAMVIEGLFGELVNLETTYLGMLAFSGAATHMSRIVAAAGDIPVIDMSARHYPYEIIQQTAYAAAVGGARGTSTRAGQRYVLQWLGTGKGEWIRIGDQAPREFKVYGTIPHCLNAVMDGSSVAAAKAYLERFPDVPLTVLIDFEGRELDVCREAAKAFGKQLAAVRIDTHGARIHQDGHTQPVPEFVDRILAAVEDPDAARQGLERYGFGPGVTIESVYNVRRVLDKAGARHTKVFVSSGFTAEKVAAFRACEVPMDAIGTGSWVEFLMFTSDVTHVFENRRWDQRSKAGRADEIKVPELPRRVQRD